MTMTRGDFILSMVSSLIATILFEFFRNVSPQVLLRTLTTAARESVLALARVALAFHRIPTVFLSSFISIILAVFYLAALPLQTVLAPTTPLHFAAHGVWESDGKSFQITISGDDAIRFLQMYPTHDIHYGIGIGKRE